MSLIFRLLPAVCFTALCALASGPQMPFAFVANAGQAEARVRYVGTGNEFKAWFREDGVVLQQRGATVAVHFAGANVHPEIAVRDATGARANYLRGSDPARWRTGLALYGALRYAGLWPGVDVVYKSDGTRVKAEYTVAPGASVDEIRLRFDAKPVIDGDGSLRIETEGGSFVEAAPVLFQVIAGERREVAGEFHRFADGTIGFAAAEYDRSQPLVIDPAIVFSGYFGGGSQEAITGVAVDLYNNVVVSGWTSSTDLPASGGVKTRNAGGVDVFVASFAPNGGALSWCTYLGGAGDDRALGIAVDGARNVYVTGYTSSVNFPVLGPLQSRLSGTRDAFVAKLNPAGTALFYSTYLGGSGIDSGNAIAVDSSGSAVISGDTSSTNLPVSLHALQARSGGAQDTFVARLSPAGNTLSLMTYLGGSGVDHGTSVKVDGSGNIFAAGATYSVNFPTASPYQARNAGGQDGFLSKLSADGSTLLFSTYLGGTAGSSGQPETVSGIYVDLLGNVVAAGTTASANFPVTAGAFQLTFGGGTDGFICRFSNAGLLVNSTFLGGSSNDGINALALDYHGDAYVAGYTGSEDFPVLRAVQSTNNGTINAFAIKLNPTLTTMVFGTYLGGSGSDSGSAIAVDVQTSIIIGGQTSSQDFPLAGNLEQSLPAQLTSFLSKITPNFTIAIDAGSVMVTDPWHISWDTVSTVFGNAGDLPVTGDWTGTGKKQIGVFRNGTWYLDTNGNGYLDSADRTVVFGQAGDVPVVGDWTGTGHIALGLYRNGTFILDRSGHLTGVATGLADVTYPNFGLAGDIPVSGDWNGSGTSKVGVFRSGLWLVDYNGDGAFTGADRTYTYGIAGDLPVMGDWDSSGHAAKIGVYRNGLWILDYDGDNAITVGVLNEMVIGFGTFGFLPLIF